MDVPEPRIVSRSVVSLSAMKHSQAQRDRCASAGEQRTRSGTRIRLGLQGLGSNGLGDFQIGHLELAKKVH